MPIIDLTRYVVASAGTWTDPAREPEPYPFARGDTWSPSRLMLRWAGDFVALTGPLRVRVTVQAENLTVPLALVGSLMPEADAGLGEVAGAGGRGAFGAPQAGTIYSYTLDIAAGQAWPFTLSESLDAARLRGLGPPGAEHLGNNLGFRVVIEPAFAAADCVPVGIPSDLPCDFATADRPDTSSFFPAACEPCEGHVIGLPPSGAVALVTPPAPGGCVRTRFFDGMSLAREDLETEQRYHRLKAKLHNRAAGAGVVWGFGVCKEGDRIRVSPGYGVDCCGNDLALTTAYRVDVAALLADPAAAPAIRQRGPRRMHLLLEYVECPSDPRPVHGDPCSTGPGRCETSRVRESVRLRLVPPRDPDSGPGGGPIGRFLEEVRGLRDRFPTGPGPGDLEGDRAPFRLAVRATSRTGAALGSVTVRPSPATGQITFPPGVVGSIVVRVRPDWSWTFVAGTMSGEAIGRDGRPAAGVARPADPVPFSARDDFQSAAREVEFTIPSPPPEQVVFRLSGWRAQSLFAAEGDPAPSGDLTLILRFGGREVREGSLVETPIVVEPIDLDPAPCAGGPCRAEVEPRRPQRRAPGDGRVAGPSPPLPWLHEDPADPEGAGDPKALAMAALGGWLAQMLARERAGTPGEVASTRREAAGGIYRAAWLLLFGLPGRADPAALGRTLRRLLEGWCDKLLWEGPRCPGEPHGVVIGCAVVEGGTIGPVDPFGGRRHVMHYPLLEHWGSQFGVAPPDAIASGLFSKLCCVASLPPLGVDSPGPPGLFFPIGGGFLGVGDPEILAGQLGRRRVVARREVGLPEFLASTFALIAGLGPATDEYQALVLADFVAGGTVILLLPDPQ